MMITSLAFKASQSSVIIGPNMNNAPIEAANLSAKLVLSFQWSFISRLRERFLWNSLRNAVNKIALRTIVGVGNSATIIRLNHVLQQVLA
jgi:hypothetical protein